MDKDIKCSNCGHFHDSLQCPSCGHIEGEPIQEESARIDDAFEDLDYE